MNNLYELRYGVVTAADIPKRLKTVLEKVDAAALKRPKELQYVKPRLVAVSKQKPVDMIIAAYEQGQRHFGENYMKELREKSNHPQILEKCKDINWHFIGHLQSNKVSKLRDVPRLFMVESVDSEKIATQINNTWEKVEKAEPLKVLIQINTSREPDKSGIHPTESCQLVKYIQNQCPKLKFAGLMTIGYPDFDYTKRINPDFECLVTCRQYICDTLHLPKESMELSMGMSHDYEHAIELGSTNVRVGSSIFGERPLPPKLAVDDAF